MSIRVKRGFARFAAFSLLATGLYVASLGPMLAICERLGIPLGFIEVIYAPIALLHQVPAFAAVFECYIGLWVDNDGCGGMGDGG
ncbi:MAG TPA: hypothetical protein VGO90_01430 [Chthoniobacteraceae bacterium]|nr:hypothetical protein [Chthoniobacteraceae bacterium]